MKQLVRTGLTAALLAASVFGAASTPPVRALSLAEHEPGEIVVRLAPGLDALGLHQTYGTVTLAQLPDHPDILLLQTPAGVPAEQLVQAMTADARLLYAELNYINESPQDGSTDRIYGWGDSSTSMQGQDSTKGLHLDGAHALGRGAGSLVAVLDTGVQPGHPALAGSLEALGYDFVDDDLMPADEPNGLDDDGDGRVDELVGHGTHVAGIVQLVAPEARLLVLRVLNSDGRGNNFRTAAAIVYAAQRRADAINLSLGTPAPSLLLRDMVALAARQGVLVAAAAGNANSTAPQYPAADACAAGVTSVGGNDKKSSFANYGEWVGLSAPGEDVYSAFPVDGYAWWSGTSMATPFVAGQAALLRGVNQGLTLDELGRLIGGTAHNLDQRNLAYQGLLGQGRIDLAASMEVAAAGAVPAGAAGLFSDCIE